MSRDRLAALSLANIHSPAPGWNGTTEIVVPSNIVNGSSTVPRMFRGAEEKLCGVLADEVVLFAAKAIPKTLTVAHASMSSTSLAAKIMRECDDNQSGLITFSEFARWSGKADVVGWIDQHHQRIVARFGDVMEAETFVPVAGRAKSAASRSVIDRTRTPDKQGRFPWEGLSSVDLLKVLRQ